MTHRRSSRSRPVPNQSSPLRSGGSTLLLGALGLVATFALAACSSSSAQSSDSGTPSGGHDAGLIPMSCGSTDDCQAYGLDADTCVYRGDAGDCAQIGQCQELKQASSSSKCTPEREVCPCSGGTQTIPACWQGFSPIPVQSYGACPVDAGLSGG
jgi:hypothetical protein